MTAYPLTRPGKSPVLLLLLAVLILVAAIALPPVLETTHASQHAEATLIRQCAKDPGNLLQIWLNQSGERFNCLIDLGDGKVGNYVLQPCARGILEITAYLILSASLEDAVRVLAAKGCARVY